MRYIKLGIRDRAVGFQAGEKQFDLMIAGFMYIVDIENGVQYRREHPTRRRRIKRDLVDIPNCKGVAGIVCRHASGERSGGDGGEERRSSRPTASPSNNQRPSANNPQLTLGSN